MIKELYQYDVLRTDRTTTRWSLEVRVPFLDKKFIQFMMSINPKFKMCKNTIEKKIFRDSFNDRLLLEIEELKSNLENMSMEDIPIPLPSEALEISPKEVLNEIETVVPSKIKSTLDNSSQTASKSFNLKALFILNFLVFKP